MREANKYYPPDDFRPPVGAKYAMVRGIREAFRPGTEPKVADIEQAAGPQPYDKVFANGVTGAPNAAAAVAPPPPPPPAKKKEDVTGLY